MRNFMINALDKLVGIVVVLMLVFVVLGALMMMAGGGGMAGMGGMGGMPGMGGGGVIGGLIFLVVGLIYVVFVGGFMYLGLGIYHNTRRMAEAMERQP